MGIGSKYDLGKQVLGSVNETEGGKKSGPAAPDYMALADKTGAQAQQLATQNTWANRADQTGPYGSLTWGSQDVIDPATGQHVTKWTQNTDVAPELKNAFNAQLGLQTDRTQLASSLMPRAEAEYSQPMDWSQFQQGGSAVQAGNLNTTSSPYGFGDPRSQAPALQNQLDYSGLQGVQGSAQARQSAQDAIYQSATSRLDPQWQQQQSQLENQLANQGITQNSTAYQNAMAAFQRQKTDAYQQAQMGSITGAGAEAQRNTSMDMALRQQQAAEAGNQGQFANAAQQAAYQQGLGAYQFGLGQQQQAFSQDQAAGSQNFQQQLQASQYQNQLRQQQIADAMQQRGFSLNEMNAIMNGQQVNQPQFGNYNQAQSVSPTDYMGAAKNQYGASMDQYNAQQAQRGQTMGALASVAMMFSDIRVKRDVKRVGRHPRGFGIYRYRYIGERGSRIGVIAQDVRRFAPELVSAVRGVLQVNYAGL